MVFPLKYRKKYPFRGFQPGSRHPAQVPTWRICSPWAMRPTSSSWRAMWCHLAQYATGKPWIGRRNNYPLKMVMFHSNVAVWFKETTIAPGDRASRDSIGSSCATSGAKAAVRWATSSGVRRKNLRWRSTSEQKKNASGSCMVLGPRPNGPNGKKQKTKNGWRSRRIA